MYCCIHVLRDAAPLSARNVCSTPQKAVSACEDFSVMKILGLSSLKDGPSSASALPEENYAQRWKEAKSLAINLATHLQVLPQ